MVGHTIDVPVRLEVLWLPGMVPSRLDEITERIFITMSTRSRVVSAGNPCAGSEFDFTNLLFMAEKEH
jgi:hypothetical protein